MASQPTLSMTVEPSLVRGGAVRRLWERLAHLTNRQDQRRWQSALLTKAAGISCTTLVCHRDTWQFIDLFACGVVGWRSPSDDEISLYSPFLLEIRLSGPQLVHIVIAMSDAAGVSLIGETPAGCAADRAIAWRIFAGIADVIDDVNPAAEQGNPVPTIMIDDQLAPTP
ncbi:MAG TPA: hypothetical protein VE172_16740 [Stackebrandtia sp.]|jgi:hypothetical protein|uniref:hypothetical protein n=1 Tax=Stackebrandtia sp. TaxID=2023065 RepID=UPI002D55AB4A|nr:hypothetical protein [Stackebrandtia sp.]HZE40450.1 hypothetical protein [Stackebrandtia sp.]